MASQTLKSVPLVELDNLQDERSKTLHALFRQNHRDLALLREPRLIFHSHMPHMLGSAYLLGFPEEKLVEMYQSEAAGLKPTHVGFIQDGITKDNWTEFLHKKKYTVAYTNFFDQRLADFNGDWKELLHEYLFTSPEPLINGYTGGLGHPFIHLAYAYEFNSPEIATEALSMGCTEKDKTHVFLDTEQPDTSTYKSFSISDILVRVEQDERFANLCEVPGFANIATIFEKATPAFLEHWNAWEITDPNAQFEEALDTAAKLLMGTSNEKGEYDFYLAHTLTVGHALRVLLPHFPVEHHISVLRQFWIFVLYCFIAQLRPSFQTDWVQTVDLKGRGWEWVSAQGATGPLSNDCHRVKVLRAFKMMEETWGAKGGRYLTAAVKYVDEFSGWTGFGRGVDGLVVEE